jgi:hypothetical protein
LTRLAAADRADTVIRLLDDPATLRAAEDDPTGFVDHDGLMIIDEIQLWPRPGHARQSVRHSANDACSLLELLSSVFLIKSVPAWSSGPAHRAIGTPKLAFVDVGIASHLIGQDAARLGEPGGAAGPMMENFVVMELTRQLTWSEERARLHHYRTKDKLEVDAVLETPDGRVVGVEVKAGATVRRLAPRALSAGDVRIIQDRARGFVQDGCVTVDLDAAASFMTTHGRVLDRRRFALLLGETDTSAVLAAVDGYRNPDGGYGWGLEPDLRAPESQPGGALHAFEVFEDIAPATTPHAVELCDWLAGVTLPDGGLPFALPVSDPAGCAPFWAQADPSMSTLQSTAFVAGAAHRVAAHDQAVAAHPWLEKATRYCLDAIAAVKTAPHAIEMCFAVQFLDAVHETHPEAAELLDHLGQFIPDNGLVHVDGGADGECLRPLDFSPIPDRPARALYTPDVVDAELRRLADQQQDDGGWRVDFASYSPAAALDWRGHATVRAVSVLQRNSVV